MHVREYLQSRVIYRAYRVIWGGSAPNAGIYGHLWGAPRPKFIALISLIPFISLDPSVVARLGSRQPKVTSSTQSDKSSEIDD